MPKRKDESELKGQRFGHLVVISDSCSKAKNGHKKILCLCDCGNTKEVYIYHLKSGASKSCGCGVIKSTIRRNTTHGDTGTRLHSIWLGMRRRCSSKNDIYYGGKGINICPEWNDYLAFKTWSLSNGYREDLTIDRIDVNSDYCPSNCRWICFRDQAKNRTNNRVVEINGQLKLMTEWIRESPVSNTTVYDRLRKGWTLEEALFLTDRRKIKKGNQHE